MCLHVFIVNMLNLNRRLLRNDIMLLSASVMRAIDVLCNKRPLTYLLTCLPVCCVAYMVIVMSLIVLHNTVFILGECFLN